MLRCIHRTNVYLTEEQQRALDARAQVEGTTRSAILRSILDRELAADRGPDAVLEVAFGALADGYGALTDGLFDDDPDLRIDR